MGFSRKSRLKFHRNPIFPLATAFILFLFITSVVGYRAIGSSPPGCRWQCGRCSPCQAVHVPIHPGISLPLEYYPEAWRCKCGNKLFTP